ncbi:hypothetical protein M7I_4099 [Glarea lozoyensis 74030]|uniref:Uncharacterized protein n=1 Tax=Glarea lozoyensis (strain ATCC 74030 / MF5533) TaxID=1104152 RepID=H0EN96_GLAL7|nr:hypothetical protein M7I_4099 [Glarea lozoyensis 74030]
MKWLSAREVAEELTKELKLTVCGLLVYLGIRSTFFFWDDFWGVWEHVDRAPKSRDQRNTNEDHGLA